MLTLNNFNNDFVILDVLVHSRRRSENSVSHAISAIFADSRSASLSFPRTRSSKWVERPNRFILTGVPKTSYAHLVTTETSCLTYSLNDSFDSPGKRMHSPAAVETSCGLSDSLFAFQISLSAKLSPVDEN